MHRGGSWGWVGGSELVVGGVFGFYSDSLPRKHPGTGVRRLGLTLQSCQDPAVSLKTTP